jgi:predicted cupin superfamily sugar epimerase
LNRDDHPPLTAEDVIARLGLEPLAIEGGWFRETHRSPTMLPAHALPPVYAGDRATSTTIYYLLTPSTFSALHRLPSDEVYHFLHGDPVEMLQLPPGAPARRVTLGPDLRAGEHLQEIVPAGVWQGSRLRPGGIWALMGVTVAPGFEYADYQHANVDALCATWPDAADQIRALHR